MIWHEFVLSKACVARTGLRINCDDGVLQWRAVTWGSERFAEQMSTWGRDKRGVSDWWPFHSSIAGHLSMAV